MNRNISFPLPLTASEAGRVQTDTYRLLRGIYVPASEFPDTGPHDLPVLTRAAAMQLARPSTASGGIAALQAYGVPHLNDTAILHGYARSRRHTRDVRLNIIWRELRSDPIMKEAGGSSFRLVSAETALIDCLSAIRDFQLRHWVPHIPGLPKELSQMVIFVDAVRTHLGVSVRDIQLAGRARLNAGVLARVCHLSDCGADSPRETILRLIVRDVATWESQYPYWLPSGALLTKADLASEKHKVALFYDGGHHLDRSQRDYDTFVTQELRSRGWEPIRITNGQLSNPSRLRGLVARFINGKQAPVLEPARENEC